MASREINLNFQKQKTTTNVFMLFLFVCVDEDEEEYDDEEEYEDEEEGDEELDSQTVSTARPRRMSELKIPDKIHPIPKASALFIFSHTNK